MRAWWPHRHEWERTGAQYVRPSDRTWRKVGGPPGVTRQIVVLDGFTVVTRRCTRCPRTQTSEMAGDAR